MRQWGLPLGAVLLLVLAATVALARPDVVPGGEGHKAPGLIAQLVDEDGQALARLAVRVDGRPVTADADGFVRTPMGGGPELVTVTAPDRLPRTQAVAPGVATVVRLTAADPGTVSVRFGGDVMFGRRFYDRDEDGDRSDGLLDTDPSVAEHAALLSEVRPLLEDADLTVVNLESALTERPWTDPTGPRPEGLHPTKDLVLTSAPESAEALVDSGVDAVSLGNDHVYDALAAGMDSTLTALDGAGLAHFGAGRTVDEAWAPAYLERRGQRLALLGCTTVTGAGEGIPHVAGPAQGGAAECSTERLDRAVRDARASADVVVVMVHGGVEYADRQADAVEQLSATATAAGAALVVDGHPHVVGGVSVTRTALIAETMGNLLSDQRIWPSSLSYLLRVDVRDGAPVQATVDPLLLEDYVPRPTVGLLADAAARRAADRKSVV